MSKIGKKVLLLLLLVIFFSASQHSHITQINAQSANCDVSNDLMQPISQEIILLALINTYRQQNSLGALSWSAGLKRSSAWQSSDMSVHSSFNHTDSLGRDPGARIKNCGYNWTSYAENIFMGSSDPQAVFTAWKNSSSHNANMLNANAKEAGISSANSYWTLDLGSSSSSPVATPTSTQNPTPSNPVNSPTPSVSITPGVSPAPASTSPTPTPSIITNLTDTQMDVSIKLNGVGTTGNKFPKHLTRQVAIGVFDSSNKKILSGNGFLKYDGKDFFRGVIHLGQLSNDVYTIKAASNYTLVSQVVPQFQNLSSENVNVLPVVGLTQGDLNADNVIDINDYNLALPCFQFKSCQTKDVIDFNDDGKADVIDYNLLLSAFRRYEGD